MFVIPFANILLTFVIRRNSFTYSNTIMNLKWHNNELFLPSIFYFILLNKHIIFKIKISIHLKSSINNVCRLF